MMLSVVRHPKLVLFSGISINPAIILWDASSYMDTLDTVLYTKSQVLHWSLVLQMSLDVAIGMGHLYGLSTAISHRHLCSQVIHICKSDWHVKICEYGVINLIDIMGGEINQGAGSKDLPWLAPEVIVDEQITEKSDIYGFGMLLYEMMFHEIPFGGLVDNSLAMKIVKGYKPDQDVELDCPYDELSELMVTMRQCWLTDPSKRPSFHNLADGLEEVIESELGGDVDRDLHIIYPHDIDNTGDKPNLSFKNLKLGPVLGEGAYATVYEGKYGDITVAAKKVIIKSDKKIIDAFYRECRLMASLRHPNIVLFLGLTTNNVEMFMLTELLPRGSFHQMYHHMPKPKDLKSHILLCYKLSIDGAKGMLYLHTLNPPLIHRDIKSPNLLIDDNWNAKIADFGLSRYLDDRTRSKAGSPLWVAPEILLGEGFDCPSDVYSFSIVMWEMMQWDEPYPDILDPNMILANVSRGYLRPDKIPYCPEKFWDLMCEMWTQNPKSRPDFHIVLERLEDMKIELEEEMGLEETFD